MTLQLPLTILRPLARLRKLGRRRDPRRLVYIACEACGRPVNLGDAIEDVDGWIVCPVCVSTSRTSGPPPPAERG